MTMRFSWQRRLLCAAAAATAVSIIAILTIGSSLNDYSGGGSGGSSSTIFVQAFAPTIVSRRYKPHSPKPQHCRQEEAIATAIASTSSELFLSLPKWVAGSRHAPNSRQGCRLVLLASTALSSLSSSDAINKNSNDDDVDCNKLICDLLQLARELGPVGSRQSAENQQRLLDLAMQLSSTSSCSFTAPARLSLTGTHQLVYSATKGASSGTIGPLVGRVTQEFVDDEIYINAVTLGPVQISVYARRQTLNDTDIKVTFYQMKATLFGVECLNKDITGGGVWKMLYAGTIDDIDGRSKLVRVMTTPSLFIIEQVL